jgi:hypothetical protein
MKRPIIRLSIASTATNKQKKSYSASIEAYKKAGLTVLRDWTNAGEQDAYVILPKGNRSKQIAGYRIASALNNAFSYSYVD